MCPLNHRPPGALPPFRAFALTAREGLVALPRVSLPSVAGPGLQALPPAEVEGWPSAILNAAYGAYTMETICGTTHCDCLPDSNITKTDIHPLRRMQNVSDEPLMLSPAPLGSNTSSQTSTEVSRSGLHILCRPLPQRHSLHLGSASASCYGHPPRMCGRPP